MSSASSLASYTHSSIKHRNGKTSPPISVPFFPNQKSKILPNAHKLLHAPQCHDHLNPAQTFVTRKRQRPETGHEIASLLPLGRPTLAPRVESPRLQMPYQCAHTR